jgi:hypothetical protein
MKFMTMVRGSEHAGPPPPALMAGIAQLGEEAAAAGVFVEMGGLHPSIAGARIRVEDGQLAVMDGPFTETKEVIGGYAVYDVQSKDEAIAWATRFMELHKQHWPGWEGECEIRQLFGPEDYARMDGSAQ